MLKVSTAHQWLSHLAFNCVQCTLLLDNFLIYLTAIHDKILHWLSPHFDFFYSYPYNNSFSKEEPILFLRLVFLSVLLLSKVWSPLSLLFYSQPELFVYWCRRHCLKNFAFNFQPIAAINYLPIEKCHSFFMSLVRLAIP